MSNPYKPPDSQIKYYYEVVLPWSWRYWWYASAFAGGMVGSVLVGLFRWWVK